MSSTGNSHAAHQIATYSAQAERRIDQYVASLMDDARPDDPLQDSKLLASLSDDEVLAMLGLRLPKKDDRRLSKLLDGNREGVLNSRQKQELDDLMRVVMHGTLKKAIGLVEAVRRNLLPRLDA